MIQNLSKVFRPLSMSGTTGGLDPDAAIYLTAAGITNSAHRAAFNTYIIGLKNAGLWNKIIARYITFNSSTTAVTNLKGATFTGTIVNTPTIGSNGYTATLNSYFRTGITPSTHLTALDLHIGAYVIGNGFGNGNKIAGSVNAANQRLTLSVGANSDFSEIYSGAPITYTHSNGSVLTHYVNVTKTAASATTLYYNGSSRATATPSGTMPTYELIFDGSNEIGTFTPQGQTRRYGMFTVGNYMDATQQAADYTLTNALLTALGLI